MENKIIIYTQRTDMRSTSFPNGGITMAIVMNPPDRKTGKLHLCTVTNFNISLS